MLLGQQRRLALDVGLGAPATAHPRADIGRIQAKPVALRQDDPGKVLVVGLLEGVADWRQAVETGGPSLRGLAFPQHDRERGAALTAAQEMGQIVERFDGKTEGIQQIAVALAQHLGSLASRLGPVLALRHPPLQLVKGEQSFVVEPWQSRLQRRQGLRQESERRVPVGLSQHFPAEALHLPHVHVGIDRRRLPGCAAQRRFPGTQDNQEHRCRTPPLSRLPAGNQGCAGGCAGDVSDRHLDCVGSFADKQTHGL